MSRGVVAAGILVAISFTFLSVGALVPSTTHSVSQLLPNLEPHPASELRIAYTDNGEKLLRFTTLGWNSGAGPLEVVAGDVGPDETGTTRQKVYQRVYDDAGGYQDYFAGFMDWHEEHDHFHFNDYARYTLRPADANGKSERYGEKVTFCLMDTDRIDHKLPGAPKRPQYTSCGLDRQGISVGWGDAYRYYLEGQHIDITGLPDGDYDLIIELDPRGRLVETDSDDNTSVTRIRITGDTVQVITTSDGGGGPGNGGGGGPGGGGPGNGGGRPPR
jgi:hypothetical protein